VTRRERLAGAAVAVLIGVAIVRTAVPDRARLRALSVQGLDIPSEKIGAGERVVREVTWTPPADIFILGWNYRIGAEALGSDLVLMVDGARVLHMRRGDTAGNPAFFPSGGAYLVRKGQTVKLLYAVGNTGPAGETRGAGALIYFVPVEGN
jgi:hypothetical protein